MLVYDKFAIQFFLFIFYQVLSATLNGFIHCSCNHLTSFGGALLIKPNPIDFDKVSVEFNSLQETGNVAVIATISVVLLCFIVVQVIIRKADKKDARNVSSNDDTFTFYARCLGGHGFDSYRGHRMFLCPTLVSC